MLLWVMNLGFAASEASAPEPEAEVAPAASTATGPGGSGGPSGALLAAIPPLDVVKELHPEPVFADFFAEIELAYVPPPVIATFAASVKLSRVTPLTITATAPLYIRVPQIRQADASELIMQDVARLKRRLRELEDERLLGL